MKSLLIVSSYHHHNTEKLAQVLADVLDAKIEPPQHVNPKALPPYDLIGFGSGIYSDAHHPALLRLADRLPPVTDSRAFIFSTSGTPAFALTGSFQEDYVEKAHAALREKLRAKGYVIVDEFMCPGFNTNSFLKLFGGINRGHPNAEDLKRAEAFAQDLMGRGWR